MAVIAALAGSLLAAASPPATSASASAPGASAPAAPAVVIFGGGAHPESTQASIEAHVRKLARTLRPLHPTVLFASGSPKVRAVQEFEPADPTSDLLARLHDQPDNLHVRYRPTYIRKARASTKPGVLRALKEAATHPRGVVVFGAGHGGPATESRAATLELWGKEGALDVDELATFLDETPFRGPVTLVLGHCHSGAFSRIMYRGGDPALGLAQPARCVLTAVPAEREASGCTADVRDPSAQAYLPVLAESLTSVDADREADGMVSLAEAHARTLREDRTIDLPVRSSELWLEATAPSPPLDVPIGSLRVRPEDEPLFEEPDAPKTVAAWRARAERHAEMVDERLEDLDRARDEYEAVRSQLAGRLLDTWPELLNPYHPRSRRLLSGRAKKVSRFLAKLKARARLTQAARAVDRLDRRAARAEKRHVRTLRGLRRAEAILREHAIRDRGHEGTIAALDRLLACEARTLPPLASKRRSR